MKTVFEKTISEIIINKSKFIAITENINDAEDAVEKINHYKNKYKGATHYCYGYITTNSEKCSDDKEPAGTAGIPILNVLKRHDLTNVLGLVVRYYGGIKLGSGGLLRAYTTSISTALEQAKICSLEKGYYIKISLNYENIKIVDKILNNYDVTKSYDDIIIYQFQITEKQYLKIMPILSMYVLVNEKKPILIKV